jgi:hypothetical protein
MKEALDHAENGEIVIIKRRGKDFLVSPVTNKPFLEQVVADLNKRVAALENKTPEAKVVPYYD